jgi:hypothetical protein
MSTSHPRPRRAWAQQTIALLVATCVCLLAISAGAAARSAQPTAAISSAVLHKAIATRTADRRALARDSSKLTACLHVHSGKCNPQRHAVKGSRAKLARARRLVQSLEARAARRHHTSKGAHRPSGATSRSGSSSRSMGAAGSTKGSGNSIGTSSGAGSGTGPTRGSGTSSGTGSGAGSSGTGSGTGSGGNSGGSSEGTSGSGGSASSGALEMGVVAGSALTFERPFIQKLGAHTARMEFEIDTPTSQMAPTIEAYARAGIKPLLLASFHGTLPTTAAAQNLASWASAFGPGGTLWQGQSFPAGTAVTDIEFGNETSYAYQYPDTSKASNWYALSSYAARAQTYALRFKDAQTAIQAANSKVGLLAQADDGDSGSSAWVDNMFAAVPDLAGRVAGWTVHPYGPKWQTKIDKLVSSTAADGAPNTIPIYVTEWGLASDNGRCLSDNYGWNTCMTFSEAATTLDSTVSAMKSRYGGRLAAFYLYQARDQALSGSSTDRESYFGAVQNNEAPKGAYTTTVESLLTANP